MLTLTLYRIHVKLSGIMWTPIRYVTLYFGDRRGAASLRYRNRAENTILMCEQKPDPVRFSCRRKSYPLLCEHRVVCCIQPGEWSLELSLLLHYEVHFMRNVFSVKLGKFVVIMISYCLAAYWGIDWKVFVIIFSYRDYLEYLVCLDILVERERL